MPTAPALDDAPQTTISDSDLPWDPEATRAIQRAWELELKRKHAVLPISGPGTRLWVENGELCIRGGVPDAWVQPVRPGKNPRYEPSLRLTRAVHGLDAIVLTDFGYNLTSDAWEWCSEQDVALLSVSLQGNVVLNLVPGHVGRGVAARMCQYAIASSPELALAVARALVLEKLTRMTAAIPKLVGPRKTREAAIDSINAEAAAVTAAASLEALRLAEGRSTLAYFRSLACEIGWSGAGVPVSWRRWDGVRTSAVGWGNRCATHPVNALLNFIYTLHAGRLERALVIEGLDPHVGFLHAIRHRRASMAWDLLEMIRPSIDARALAWVRERRWRRRDFNIDTHGQVWLSPGLAQVASQRGWLSDATVDHAVQWLRERLAD